MPMRLTDSVTVRRDQRITPEGLRAFGFFAPSR
jgi:hypothetical protein